MCKGGSQLGSEKIRILQLTVSIAKLDGNYIKQNKTQSKFLKRSTCGSLTNPEHQHPQKGLVKKHILTQSQEKSIKHCMTAKLTGKPKVSKVNPVSSPFLNRLNFIS